LGMHPAVITNGSAASRVDEDAWATCDWVRVSLNTLEYDKEIEIGAIPREKVTVTGCLILHEGFMTARGFKKLLRIHQWAQEQEMPTRVVCDTIATSQELAGKLLDLARGCGAPFTCFDHDYGSTPACYMPWWKPCVDWDGYLYPCPSIECSPEMNWTVPKSFRLCHATQMGSFYADGVKDAGHRCSFCKYRAQNVFLAEALAHIEHTHHV
jgi:hypothetical protein